FLLPPRAPSSTLFPYTTLFRSLSGLCHPLRHDFYISQPPAVIYALDECVCWPYGDPSRATTSIAKQRYCWIVWRHGHQGATHLRSEEHTSELQSRENLVCRLLL